jgi:hypothetical protein
VDEIGRRLRGQPDMPVELLLSRAGEEEPIGCRCDASYRP